MHTSKAIYRLAKLARLLDIEGCKEDVEALNDAVEYMTQKLKDEQVSISVKHSAAPIKGRSGNTNTGIVGRLRVA